MLSPLLKHQPNTTSLCSYPLFGLHKFPARIDECQWVPFFLHEGIQSHTLPFFSAWKNFVPGLHTHFLVRTSFSQAAPLLPSALWQQNVREYSWEDSTSTAIPPISTFNVQYPPSVSWVNIIKQEPLLLEHPSHHHTGTSDLLSSHRHLRGHTDMSQY